MSLHNAPLLPGLPLLAEAGIVTAILAGAAFAAGRVSRSGAIGGWVLATVIYWTLGWHGILVPLVFFLLGDGATRFGYQQKAAKGIAQEHGGRRSAKNAVANVSAGVIAALLLRSHPEPWWAVAYAATFATAAADTVSSELGQVLGKTPIHPLTFQRVEPGTEGAVSMEGTVAGLMAALICGLVAWAAGMPSQPLAVLLIGLAGAAGNWVESAVGSVIGKRVNNELINFFNTVVGGAVGWTLARLLL